jgi:sensor histidine kinase regulating citrate/malate metabolism
MKQPTAVIHIIHLLLFFIGVHECLAFAKSLKKATAQLVPYFLSGTKLLRKARVNRTCSSFAKRSNNQQS